MTHKSFTSLPRWLIAVIIIATYIAVDQLYRGSFSWKIINGLVEDGTRWQRLFVAAIVDWLIPLVLMPILVTAFIVGKANLREVLGFNKSPWRALGFAFLCTLPLPLVYALTTPLQEPSKMVLEVLYYAVVSPFSEELIFRCFLFGLLFRLAKWGFLPAAMFGGVIFAVGHLYQGHAVLDSMGIFGITFIASLWWAWLYVEWDFNAWVPIGFHVFMNGWFNIFVVSDTTLLPLAGEIARASVVILSIVLTVAMKRRQGGRTIVGSLWYKGSAQIGNNQS